MTEQHPQADSPVASTHAPAIKTEEASPSRQTGGNGNTLLTVLVVLAVLLGGYSFYRTIFPSHACRRHRRSRLRPPGCRLPAGGIGQYPI